MGLFSSNTTDEEPEPQRAFDDRTAIINVLEHANADDEFTIQTVNDLVFDFTVVEVTEYGYLYGESPTQGRRFVCVRSGTVHEPDDQGPDSLGFGIKRLEVTEMADESPLL